MHFKTLRHVIIIFMIGIGIPNVCWANGTPEATVMSPPPEGYTIIETSRLGLETIPDDIKNFRLMLSDDVKQLLGKNLLKTPSGETSLDNFLSGLYYYAGSWQNPIDMKRGTSRVYYSAKFSLYNNEAVGIKWYTRDSETPLCIYALDKKRLIPNIFDPIKDSDFFKDFEENFWDYITISGQIKNVLYADGSIKNCEAIIDYSEKMKAISFERVHRNNMSSIAKSWIERSKYKNEMFAYDLSNDGTITINAYLGSSVDVLKIPETIEELPVTVIQSMQAPDQVKIRKMMIPKSVKTIKSSAFNSLGIEELLFDKDSQLNTIEYDAFANNEIKEINLPIKSLTIYEGAFCGNKIEIIKISPAWRFYSYLNSKHEGFFKSDYLKEILFLEGCTFIPSTCCIECKNLKKISIPSTLTKIEKYAFADCTSLSEIVLPDKMCKLRYTLVGGEASDYFAFSNCPLPLKTKSELLKAGLSKQALDNSDHVTSPVEL